tara:strand:- start:852 stop:1952 length:1101 start_codon:yes stop_codon:yes gene_type:complete
MEEQQQQVQLTVEETIEKIEQSIKDLEAKNNKIFFLTQDTKGTQRASVATNYQFVKILRDNGYNAFILHEKDEYVGVGEWLSEDYTSLPHASIESGDLQVGPQDLLIIPEVFGHVIEQTVNMPCKRIVFCQSYDYIFEMLQPGATWASLGIDTVMTTSEASKEYIKSVFPNMEPTIIPLSIPDYFKADEKPKKPIVSIHTRDHRDTMKLIKSFYVKYPQYRWITFRDLRGLKREDFAVALGESCVSVWVDDVAGYGTFPLESMKCKTPVIGKVPNLKIDWLNEKNAIWTYELNQMVDMVGSFLKSWLEDSIPSELYDAMVETAKGNTLEEESKSLLAFVEKTNADRITELSISLNKIKPIEEPIKQ